MKPRVKATVGYEIGSGDNQGGGVTVIVTLYNYEAYITNALDSVRNQTFSNLELVIVDDGSQDNSARMVRQWIEKNGIRFNKAKLLCHLENHGVVQARNTAFENATSDFVFVLDADNEIYPTAIAKLQSACIQTNAEAAYSQLELFGEASGLGSANYWSPERFMYGNYVDAMALIKKAAWKAAGGYSDFTIPGWEDYDLWCKFVELGFKGVFVPEILCRYRVHASSMLRTRTNPNLRIVKSEMQARHPWLRLNADENVERVPSVEPRKLEFIDFVFAAGTRRIFFRGSSRTDKEVIKQIFNAQQYDLSGFPLTTSLKNYADWVSAKGASPLVVDAGANIGASAVYFTQMDTRFHVCAVEPERNNFSVLKTNCTGLPITPIEAAVASEAGKLWLNDPGIGEWGYRVGGASGEFQVEAITMNDILNKFDASRYIPLICKIDIEGGEENLFSTSDAWIDQFPLVIIELHDWLLPGTSNSKNFLSAISKRNFDIICRGENMFCFNNDLLSKYPRPKTGQ